MKDEYIRIRMSEQDKEKIKRGAEREGLSMSEYILTLVRIDEREHRKDGLNGK